MAAFIDFETYSEAGFIINQTTGKVVSGEGTKNGLGLVGTPVYAEHPSTDIICLFYDLDNGRGPQMWIPASPPPEDLFHHIRSGLPISGWNVTFEFYIWNMIAVRRFGWPVLPLEQCYCSMARSRRFSTPGALAAAAKVLGTSEQKDSSGKNLIQKLCRPHTTSSTRSSVRWTFSLAPDDHMAMYGYCAQDVRTEKELSNKIPHLTQSERETWLVDQTINLRGVAVDTGTLDAALDILAQAESKYTAKLIELTNGGVTGINESAKLAAWCELPNVQKETVAHALSSDNLPDKIRQVLEIRQILGSANVKKLRTLKWQTSRDGRLRNQYMYCGADRTGRASAGGVQLQNITSRGPDSYTCGSCGRIIGDVNKCPCGNEVDLQKNDEWTYTAVEWAISDIQTRSLDVVESLWGDAIDTLCGCLRGLFWARDDQHELICTDFTAIEAVVLACLARCRWRVEVFNTHGQIYLMSAAKIFGKSIEEYTEYAERTGKHHADRKIGKVSELACGYGGWIGAWRNFDKSDRSDEEIKQIILKWREDSPEIVDFWGGQYKWVGPGKWDFAPELFGLEGAAISAILNPGTRYHVNDISYVVASDILYCTLPSGRNLHYHRPKLQQEKDRLNRGMSYKILFEGYNSNAAKGPVGWIVQETYAGRLAENVTQAVAADIQFEAIKRLEAAGYPIVMHTHDEATAECSVGQKTVEEMEAIMEQRPAWAAWWPIRAKGWKGRRYGKD